MPVLLLLCRFSAKSKVGIKTGLHDLCVKKRANYSVLYYPYLLKVTLTCSYFVEVNMVCLSSPHIITQQQSPGLQCQTLCFVHLAGLYSVFCIMFCHVHSFLLQKFHTHIQKPFRHGMWAMLKIMQGSV